MSLTALACASSALAASAPVSATYNPGKSAGFHFVVARDEAHVTITLTPAGGSPRGIAKFIPGITGLPLYADGKLDKLEIVLPAKLCKFAEDRIGTCSNFGNEGVAAAERARLRLTVGESVREITDAEEAKLSVRFTMSELVRRSPSKSHAPIKETHYVTPRLDFYLAIDEQNADWLSAELASPLIDGQEE
jgi:hypothetical protein